MGNVYSDQYTTAINNKQLVKDNEWDAKFRVFFFSRTTTTAAPIANGDVLYLCRLPRGSRILGGNVAWGAMGSSATAKIGTVADDDRYLTAATSVAAVGSAALAGTIALFHGEELTVDTDIILTAGGANYAADKDIKGYLLVALT